RTLGFTWLTILIVAAELLIVITRFIFSYEQAFMADLVRFWYGALFLFASAYTLLEEGHVRVDVFYAGFKDKTKGLVNAVGSIFLGISVCWTILIIGMGSKTSIINSPVARFEVTQSGFGMYVKYMMAGFLGVFAISMMIQFVSYLLDAVADYREEPGKVKAQGASAH
ncbi:MAG: TRAP transporter small permease subunit, partial [Pseudomonadota bacterium]